MTREEIVAEAREWLGTPWQHQAHLKGVACDCAGLIRGVLIAKQLMPPDPLQWPGAEAFAGYGRQPNGSLLEACGCFMTRIAQADMQPADVVVFALDREPQHLGIITPYKHGGLAVIHASSRTGRVDEHRLWFTPKMRFVAAYRMPGVA